MVCETAEDVLERRYCSSIGIENGNNKYDYGMTKTEEYI